VSPQIAGSNEGVTTRHCVPSHSWVSPTVVEPTVFVP
jgi:hypothetical protein